MTEHIAVPATPDLPPQQTPAARPEGYDPGGFVRATFTRTFLLRVLAVAGVTIGAAAIVALVAAALLLLGGMIDSSGHAVTGATNTGTSSGPQVDVGGLPLLTALMVIVASMFFGSPGGSAVVTSGSPLAVLGLSSANAHFSVFAPMLGLLLPVLFVAFWMSWRLATVARLGARLVEAGAAGLVVGAVLELLALVGTSSVTVSGVRLEVSAVGFPLFAGGLLATFLASAAGSALAMPDGRRRTLPALVAAIRALPTRLSGWATAPLVVAGIWAVCFGFATFVGLIVAGLVTGSATLAFASPIVLGTASVMAAAVGQVGVIVSETRLGSAQATTGGDTISVFTGAPWLWLTVAVAVVAAVLSAIALRRMVGWRPIWLLPVVAVVAWAALPWVLAVVDASASLGTGAIDLAASASAHITWWFGVVAGVWALAIEALARWVIPAWTMRAVPGTARTRVLSLIVVAVLVLVGVVVAIGSSAFSASNVASAYLGQLEHGDMKAASTVAGTGSVLPLPASPADRISHPEVVAVHQSGDVATAAVRYTLAGKSVDADVRLKKQGTSALIFPRWVVAAPLVSTITVTESLTDAVQVGGHAVSGSDGSAAARVLPGVYAAVGDGDAAQFVAMSPSRVLADGTTDVTVAQQPTAALTNAVQDEVQNELTTCADSTDAIPSGCPFAAFVFGSYQNLTWSIDEQPTVEISGGGRFWTATGGLATATYEVQDFFDGSYSPDSSSVSMYPQFGIVSVTANGVSVHRN